MLVVNVDPKPVPEASAKPYRATAVDEGRAQHKGGVAGENNCCKALISANNCGTGVT